MDDAATAGQSSSQSTDHITPARAKLGLIIPAVNTLSEPQFQHFAPQGMGIHVMRARIAGNPSTTLADLRPTIEQAADILTDMSPDMIVFHCTGTSMKEGTQGDRGLIDLIEQRTKRPACSTIGLVVEAMRALGMSKVVVLSPYKTNKDAISYLAEVGIKTVNDVALACASGADFVKITPQQWVELARQNDRPEADGIFLSCTNTTQIEAVDAIERALGKPVVNSNQAVIWGAAKRLKEQLGDYRLAGALGRLVREH
jgi:maleate isomerase